MQKAPTCRQLGMNLLLLQHRLRKSIKIIATNKDRAVGKGTWTKRGKFVTLQRKPSKKSIRKALGVPIETYYHKPYVGRPQVWVLCVSLTTSSSSPNSASTRWVKGNAKTRIGLKGEKEARPVDRTGKKRKYPPENTRASGLPLLMAYPEGKPLGGGGGLASAI